MVRNKTIIGEQRDIILRVLHYFEEEKRAGNLLIPIDQAYKRTSAATGVSIRTVTRIRREEKKILQATSPSPDSPLSIEQTSSALATPAPLSYVKLTTPGKRRNRRPKVNVDDTTVNTIRNIIDSFTYKNEVPTVKKILDVARRDFQFAGQRESLRKIIGQKLRYKFKKRVNKGEVSEDTEDSISDEEQKEEPDPDVVCVEVTPDICPTTS